MQELTHTVKYIFDELAPATIPAILVTARNIIQGKSKKKKQKGGRKNIKGGFGEEMVKDAVTELYKIAPSALLVAAQRYLGKSKKKQKGGRVGKRMNYTLPQKGSGGSGETEALGEVDRNQVRILEEWVEEPRIPQLDGEWDDRQELKNKISRLREQINKHEEKSSPNKRQSPGELKGYPKQAQQFEESALDLGYLVKQAFGWGEETPRYQSNLVAYRPDHEDNPSMAHLTLHTPQRGHPTTQFHARGEKKNNGFQSKTIFQTGKKTGNTYFTKNGRVRSESSLGRATSSNESRQLTSNGLSIARDMATGQRREWQEGERQAYIQKHLTGDPIRDMHYLKLMNKMRGRS